MPRLYDRHKFHRGHIGLQMEHVVEVAHRLAPVVAIDPHVFPIIGFHVTAVISSTTSAKTMIPSSAPWLTTVPASR